MRALPRLRVAIRNVSLVMGANRIPSLGGEQRFALDDLIRKQRCDEGDADQTAKKNHVRHSFDLKAQVGSIRIADRQIRGQRAREESDRGHRRIFIDMRRSALRFGKLDQSDQCRADADLPETGRMWEARLSLLVRIVMRLDMPSIAPCGTGANRIGLPA